MNQTISRPTDRSSRGSIVYTGLILLMLVFTTYSNGTVRVYALDGETSNDTTGPNSENTNIVDSNINLSFSIKNNGSAQNNFDADLNTGNNDVQNNTSVGDITTGDIKVADEQVNVINSDPVIIDASVLDLDDTNIDSSNYLTGPNSENNNTIDSNLDIDINTENIATAENNFNLNLDTGNNNISNNTLVGDIETGDILVLVRLANFLNSDIPAVITPTTVVPIVPQPQIQIPLAPVITTPPSPMAALELPTIEKALGAAPSLEFASIPAEFFPAGINPIYTILSLMPFAYLLNLLINKRKLS